MDKRNIESNNAVMCIETYMCRPVMLTFFLILFITLAVLGAVLTGLLPDQYIEKVYSTRQCPEEMGSDWNEDLCKGANILHSTAQKAHLAADDTGLKYNKLLFGRPISSHEHVGVSFPLDFELNTTLGLKTTTKTVHGNFICEPQESCNSILLLRFSGYNYDIHIGATSNDQVNQIDSWVGDFELITRYDNMKFEKITIIWRYISAFFCIIMFVIFVINILRVEKSSTPEQKNALLLLIGVILYDNPLYLFNIFYRGSFWSVVDEIFSMIGVCTMMLYPLLSLGGFITSKLTFVSFYLPRYILVVLYFIFQLVVEVYVAVQSRLDPDSEVFSRSTVRTFSGLSLIIFLVWVVYFIYNLQRCVIVTKQHPKAIKGRYRVFLLWIAVICIAFHLIQVFTYIYRNSYRGSFELVRSWLASVLAVSVAILLSPTTQPRMTSTTLTGALHPKAKGTRSEATAEAIADAQENYPDEKSAQYETKADEYNVDYEGGFTGDVAEDRSW